MANNKFLQILRNFESTTRAQAIAKLEAAATSETLYHAGTPVVAFYSTADTVTFANRTSAHNYGTDVTKSYGAVFGIMGQARGSIEIFDIQTSVEDLIGGASEFTTTENSVFPSKTWDCRSLGGIQVVLEDMEGILTTEISSLKSRITAITGQSGDTYTAVSGNTYTGSSASLQGAINDLDTALAGLASDISANRIVNTDNSISVVPPAEGSSDTVVSVNIKSGETVLSNDNTANTGGLQTTINITKLNATALAALNDNNVKEAYKLTGIDGTTAKGDIIKIYKDSALQEVYLGANTDTIDASTGVITKNTVTDPQSMNFAYQLADGTYSLTKIDVSKFLTQSEFADGLEVSGAGVVSVKKDTTSGKVRTNATPSGVTPGSAEDTGLVDVLTVSSDGVKIDNIQAAIDYAVNNATTSLAISAAGDNYITAAVDANDNKKINVTADVQSLSATAGTAGVYDATTGAQTTAPSHGTLTGVADSLADSSDIATKVKTYVDGEVAIEAARVDAKFLALDGTADAANTTATTPTADFKVLTKVVETDGAIVAASTEAVNLKKVAATGAAADVSYSNTSSEMTATTVQDAIDEVEGRLDTLDGAAVKSVTGSNAININTTTSPANAQNPKVELILDDSTSNTVQTGTGSYNALSVTSDGLFLSNVWDCGEYSVPEP